MTDERARPLVTHAEIEAEIASEHYFTAMDGVHGANNPPKTGGTLEYAAPPALDQLTFCVLILKNGTKMVGINHGSVDPARHIAEVGKRMARDNAIAKVLPLVAFRRRDELAAQQR